MNEFLYEGRQYRIALPPEHHQQTAAAPGFYEQDLLEAIRGLNRAGTYIDVGAFIGNHTIYFATKCRATRVIAFEPNPSAFTMLTQNLAENAVSAKTCNVGLWIEPGSGRMEIKRPGNVGTARLAKEGTIDVELETLDRLQDPLELVEIAVIKIDVEDAEPYVLRGGLATLKRFHPIVTTEARDARHLRRISELLLPLGYAKQGPYCRTPTYLWL